MAHRILVVDDEEDLLELLASRFEANGYEVLTAVDGFSGLQEAREQKPDLIVLDVMLPQLNGYEVCSMLKQDVRYHHIPVVMFTARSQEKDEQLGKACGADAYIRKPFKPEELLGTIESLL